MIARGAKPSDHPACAAIFEAAWNDAFPAAPRSIGAAEFAAETADEIVLVAVTGGSVRGFASLYAPASFLHHLYVAPDAYRLGIGSALLAEAIARAPRPLSLKCQLANTRARAFYDRHGFVKVEGDGGDDGYGPWVRLIAPGG